MAIKTVGTRKLRDELASVLEEMSVVDDIIVTQRGEGKAVMMSLERYNKLIERLDDLEDSLDALNADRRGAVNVRDLDLD